jgi:uncharacterized protein (TIGR03067 family)
MEHDLECLQGTWNVVSLEMDGQKVSGGDARIVVRGSRFTSISMGATYEGTVTVHAASAPRGLDLRFEEGPEKGNTNFGIYELDGDTWKICLATRGSERPKEFAAPRGTGIALETLQRQTVAGAAEGTVAVEQAVAVAGDSAAELAGEWIPLSLVRDGQALDKGMLKYGKRTVTPDQVTVKFGPQVVLKAKYTVDRSRTPMTMDYVLADGGVQRGIWTFKDQRLTTCFGAPGQARPGEFESISGDGRTLTVWTPAGR